MKIEYFDQGLGSPLVLIYGNEPEKVALLKTSVHLLSKGEQKRIAVHNLPGFEGVNGCQLFFSLGPDNRGVGFVIPPMNFECTVSSTWWDNIEGLLEPFCPPRQGKGFQYLTHGFKSDIDLIISRDRSW